MEQKGKVKHYFPGGNTCQGFYSFFDSVLHNMERIFVIKGGPGTGKSTLMRLIGSAMADRGYNVEYLHCSSDNDSLDGVIVTDLKIAVVDGTAPHRDVPALIQRPNFACKGHLSTRESNCDLPVLICSYLSARS